MRCSEARKYLSPYLDSELDPTTTFQVSQHLEQCAPCATRFERERHAEGLIAERLKQGEPVLSWTKIEETVLSAPRPLYRRPAWLLAAAAAVAFMVIGLGNWSRPSRANSVEWAASELNRLSPEGTAFPKNKPCGASQLNDVCARVLERRIDLNLAQAAPHTVNLVAASSTLCPGGRGGVKLLLNCCGQPILVAMGLADTPGEFQNVANAFDADRVIDVTCKGNQYNVAVRRLGDTVIVGVSPASHSAAHIVQNIDFKISR